MSISASELSRLLSISDLTLEPTHAIGVAVSKIVHALPSDIPKRLVTGSPIVNAKHNYTLLGYREDAVVQAGRYTQWVNTEQVLRTQTTSLILGELLSIKDNPSPCVLMAPGMVYRRDMRDRWHTGQPHQMDIWVLQSKEIKQDPNDLRSLAQTVCRSVIGDVPLDIVSTSHPYTKEGIEISAKWEDQWLEVGEAGLIDPMLLQRIGIDKAKWHGLAMGVGLDRLVMVSKGLPDIRLLRDPLPNVQRQMLDLAKWKPISRQPVAVREISIAKHKNTSDELLTEQVLDSLGVHHDLLQTCEIVSRTNYEDLPALSRERLGIHEHQENILLRLTWQDLGSSLPRARVNELTRLVYKAVHEGENWAYCI